jgi:hypothetical protein
MDNYNMNDDDIPEVPDADTFQHGELIYFLTQSHEMRKTAKSALKQGLYAGGGAIAGSFLLGPVGGLVGGIAGSVIGFFNSDNYDGAVLALTKIEGSRRNVLMQEVGKVLMVAGATTQQIASSEAFRSTLLHYAQDNTVRDGIWRACLHSIQS